MLRNLVYSELFRTFATSLRNNKFNPLKPTIMEQIFELIEQVKAIKGCTFAGIMYRSTEKLPKAFGNVTKVVDTQVQLNYDYEKSVNRRLKAKGCEPNFKSDKLPWGTWYIFNKVIEHKGSFYLRMYDFEGRPFREEYYVDGRPATDSEVASIMAYKEAHEKSSKKQEAAGLDTHQTKPMNVNMENIIELRCDDIQYKQAERVAV